MKRTFNLAWFFIFVIPLSCGVTSDRDDESKPGDINVNAGEVTGDVIFADDSISVSDAGDICSDDGHAWDSPEYKELVTVQKIGKYGVGVTTLQTVSKSGRALTIEVWYPSEYDPYAEPHSYLGVMKSSAAVFDALPDPDEKPYPVIAFSHGHSSMRQQSYFLTEYLTAQGYVVAAPDHLYNTFLDNDDSKMSEFFLKRPEDISASIDRVLTAQNGDPAWLSGLAHSEMIGACGHSFGGYTSIALSSDAVFSIPQDVHDACADDPSQNIMCPFILEFPDEKLHLSDPRVKASMPIAPIGSFFFGKDGLSSITIPVFIMAAKDDTISSYKDEALFTYDALLSDKFLLSLETGEHFVFSIICLLTAIAPDPEALPEQVKTVCAKGYNFPLEKAFDLINYYAVTFFDYYLKGKKENLDILKGIKKYENNAPAFEFQSQMK
jgi:predicted dienelactone hydrolase